MKNWHILVLAMRNLQAVLRTASLLAVLGVITAAQAQTETLSPPQSSLFGAKVLAVSLKRVPPATVVIWFEAAKSGNSEVTASFPMSSPPQSALKGVRAVIADTTPGRLWPVGDAEADLSRLRDLLQQFDGSSREIELEFQVAHIEKSQLENFRFDSRGITPVEANSFTLERVGSTNFQSVLTALIASNRAKIETAPRVAVLNNSSTSVRLGFRPLAMERVDAENGELYEVVTHSSDFTQPVLGPSQNVPVASPSFLQAGYVLKVMPAINDDDTVTLRLELKREVTMLRPEKAATLDSTPSVSSVVNVRDGGIIALRGLQLLDVPPPHLREEAERAEKARFKERFPELADKLLSGTKRWGHSEFVVFIYPRIVRR